MEKRLRDVTFEEFDAWANRRAADGDWALRDAITSSKIINQVFIKTRDIVFFKSRKRNKLFHELCEQFFDTEAMIDVDR